MLDFQTDAHIFQRLLAAIKGLCTDLCLHASGDGLSMQCMDDCHACVTSFELQSSCFRSFTCDGNIDFAVKLESLEAVFHLVGPDGIVRLKKSEEGEDVGDDGGAVSDGETDRSGCLQFECVLYKDQELKDRIQGRINLVEASSETLVFEDEIEGAGCVRLGSLNFAREINVCKQLGLTSATLEVTRNSFTIKSTGETKYMKVYARDAEDAEIRCARQIRQEFAVHYLHKFCKAACLGRLLKMQISSTKTSSFEFRICDLKSEPLEGKLVFQLAPATS
eukprot:GHVQ01011158.1.p1 GENE.GHVQ01011158.1~~GHVQ01011158.1.p1  ORF type:complete len:278 (+),score=47.31 GHVQ01011158.1:941-1774(+)